MPKKSLRYVVTGMHRSGTTWVGRLLDSLPSQTLLNEPFNARTGLRGVPRWYLDDRSEADTMFLETSLKRLESGTARFKRFIGADHPPARIAAAALRGTGQERVYRKFMASPHVSFFIKDPFVLRQVSTLLARGIPTVVMVRHPAAILQSLRRMNWKMPTMLLEGREDMFGAADLENDEIAAICACWKVAYGPLLDWLTDGTDAPILLAVHEVMFEDIEGFLDDLLDFLNITDPQDRAAGQAFLQKTTTGSTVRPDHLRKHDISRDSSALAHAWRDAYDAQDLATFDAMIGQEYATLCRFAVSPAFRAETLPT